MICVTQAPKGIDNKVVSNCTTQFLGKQNAPATIEAARELIAAAGGRADDLGKLRTGDFYFKTGDGGKPVKADAALPVVAPCQPADAGGGGGAGQGLEALTGRHVAGRPPGMRACRGTRHRSWFLSRYADMGRWICRGTLTSVGENVRGRDSGRRLPALATGLYAGGRLRLFYLNARRVEIKPAACEDGPMSDGLLPDEPGPSEGLGKLFADQAACRRAGQARGLPRAGAQVPAERRSRT